jgi:hypothetical protein
MKKEVDQILSGKRIELIEDRYKAAMGVCRRKEAEKG